MPEYRYHKEKKTHKYDVIIIGAGPNGLTAGAYLSKAGLSVLLLEKKLEAGGGLATEEVTIPGFYHNTHSIYHLMVDYAPVYKDFNLEKEHNVRYVHPSLQFALPLSDGRSVCIYTDVEKTCKSLAKFSKRDADSYREIYHSFQRQMEGFLAPATYVQAVPPLDQAAKLESTELGREISSYSAKSPQAIVDELFENEHVRALMLYVACHWGLEYDVDGIGYLAVLNLNRATNYRLCVGGSHMLSQALCKIISENGGTVWGSQKINKIVTKDGKATGVELADGTLVEAKAIISTIDPPQTFLKLVGEDKLAKDFALNIKDWKWEKWSLFNVHLAMEKPPVFKDPEINNAFVYVIGCETEEELIKKWKSMGRGELTATGFNCCFPSVHDQKQAPPDRCIGLISEMAPYRIKESAEKYVSHMFKMEHASRCLATLRKYAPNMTEDNILWMTAHTPIDIQNKFSDMVEGSIKQGLYHPLTMGFLRPNEECSQHTTPIKNLYLGGASSHSGGLVTFGPGYLTANVVAEELGAKKWWAEPETVVKARQAGLL